MNGTTVRKLDNLLVVAVPGDLTDEEAIQMRRLALREVRRHRSEFVLLDFSDVDICDSYFGRFIYAMAQTVALLGSRVIVCGLQDEVVETMVDLGFLLTGVSTALDLDDALALSREHTRRRAGSTGERVR